MNTFKISIICSGEDTVMLEENKLNFTYEMHPVLCMCISYN